MMTFTASQHDLLRALADGWELKRGWSGEGRPPYYFVEKGYPLKRVDAAAVIGLLGHGFIERVDGGYQLTEKGREVGF